MNQQTLLPEDPEPAIVFAAYGQPKTAGSKRAFKTKTGKVVVTDDCKESKTWRDVIAAAARQAYPGLLLDGPLRVDFLFVVPRPKTVKREMPTTKPDVLKLARAAEDALSGVLWVDDARITTESLRKIYGNVACCVVRVRRDVTNGAPEWAQKLIETPAEKPF
jgi:Holliday junction resolvase RusA-like endonuclease